MSEDEQRPVAATFEEAFRDVQPRPDLEATLMARYPELQVEFASLLLSSMTVLMQIG